MICLICRQAEIVDGFTSITFERDEFKLVINNVPARVCPNCGEAIVDEDVTVSLLQNAKKIFDEGVREGVLVYSNN